MVGGLIAGKKPLAARELSGLMGRVCLAERESIQTIHHIGYLPDPIPLTHLQKTHFVACEI